MIISFSGLPGSGKSSIAKRLAAELGWPYYDMGQLRRQFAAKRGLTIEEYNTLGETDPTTDTEVDEYQAELGRTQDNFVIVGRTSWHFIPQSCKIFLDVDLAVGAERIFKSLEGRNEGENIRTLDDVRGGLERRQASDTLRYRKYFDIDAFDKDNYDLVIDTTNLSQEEVFQKIFASVKGKV